LRAIVRKQDRRVVGHIGCHAKPGADYSPFLRPAGVEFGYTVFAPYRRQGIARTALLGLMDWALAHGASHFILSISPENMASLSLAARLGFVKVGSHLDEKDGPEDILELRPPEVASGLVPGP
jgi:RimJ/RimL family protein N-acetyltransferase